MKNDQKQTQVKPTAVGFDDFLEDLFGLNIRGLKTIWVSFYSPKKYYAAAHTSDWHGKYTPSFRLLFTLLALVFLMQFFWGGANSPLIASYAQQMEAHSIILPDGLSYTQASLTLASWYNGFIPPFTIAFYLMLGSVYSVWGRRMSFVERQRYLFITMIPNMFITFFLFIVLAFVPAEKVLWGLWLFPTIAFLVSALTAFRGAFISMTVLARLWRAMLLAFLIVGVGQLVSLAAQFSATEVIRMKYY
ncbi:MAG: hypothetical protein COA91_06670 [Robiginitomaculum sp.]|nr:MAG: hypothetical protein COA91_06670 [Robiginitomaculum sp.]